MMAPLSFTARTASDKAKARRLIARGCAKVSDRIHETYIGRHGLVNYEAWIVELTESAQ